MASYGGHLYAQSSFRAPINWAQAAVFAEFQWETHGSPWHPATLTDAAENGFLSAMMAAHPDGDAFIGMMQDLRGTGPAGGWRWVTGEALTYTNWNAGEPNNLGGDDYGMVNINGGWNDLSLEYPS